MGRRGRKRLEQERLDAQQREPVHPMETWSIEDPFRPSEIMPREIVYVEVGDGSNEGADADG